MKLPRNIIIVGGTGQSVAMREVVEIHGSQVVAIADDYLKKPPWQVSFFKIADLELYVDNLTFEELKNYGFSIAISNYSPRTSGSQGKIRVELSDRLQGWGLQPVNLIHPATFVSKRALIAPGVQIHAGATIEPDCIIGHQCIINSGVNICHECKLGEGVEILPGATLGGLAHIKKYAFVGAGATVLDRITVGEGARVAAGALVNKDVKPYTLVMGCPAEVPSKWLDKND